MGVKFSIKNLVVVFILFILVFINFQYSQGWEYYDTNLLRHFTQPDQNIKDVYNPQDLNRYAYARNNPYKYIDPTGNEPVLSQIGSYDVIYTQLQQFETNNLGLTASQTLSSLVSFSGSSNSQAQVNADFLYYSESRYSYTSEAGFVDTLHLLTSAAKTKESGAFVASIEGYLAEIKQIKDDPSSAFSYEDLSSNKLGREFAGQLNNKDPLSEQYKKFIESKGGSTHPLTTLEKEHPGASQSIPKTVSTNKPSHRKYSSGGQALPASSKNDASKKTKRL